MAALPNLARYFSVPSKAPAQRARSWDIHITAKDGQMWTENNDRKIDAAASKTRHEAEGSTVRGPFPNTKRY